MIVENEIHYCDGENIYAINETAKLIVKSFWHHNDLCADGFIKYDEQEEIKFGYIKMTSPSDWFVPTYFKTTSNYVAVCYAIKDEIGVEQIFDVQKKCELPIGSVEREQAITNFKREFFEESQNKLDDCNKCKSKQQI